MYQSVETPLAMHIRFIFKFIFIVLILIAFGCTEKSDVISGLLDIKTNSEQANNSLPYVLTGTPTSVSPTSAILEGRVVDDGGYVVSRRGIVWSTSQNPTINSNLGNITSGSGVGDFNVNLTGLSLGVKYYARAYATNTIGTGYGNQIEFTTSASLPELSTIAISSIASNSAVSGGNITSDGGLSVTVRGVVWSTSQNPTISSNSGITTSGSGTGSYISNLTGLTAGTRYYVRAYATNAIGTSYGIQIEFSTPSSGGSTSGRDNETLVVDIRNPATGRTWMDRNLGASRAATSSTDTQAYGDLYQWGRRADGHQKRTAPVISFESTLSNSDTPPHGSFILSPNAPNDWRSPQNNNLWQGVNGVNNPCPIGYRIPTEAEWLAERQSWSTNNRDGAYSSPLKLTQAGYRGLSTGSLIDVGTYGGYWSSTVSDTKSINLGFQVESAGYGINFRAFGLSVRCIKN